MPALTAAEQECVARYVESLSRRLGDVLEEVWLFGSAARGDMWADFWPMRSDVDLLAITKEPLAPALEDELFALTYPLYLECGRQISPAFRTRRELGSRWAPLHAEVRRDGVKLWPRTGSA